MRDYSTKTVHLYSTGHKPLCNTVQGLWFVRSVAVAVANDLDLKMGGAKRMACNAPLHARILPAGIPP